jgi:hypothetical protein
VARDIAETLSPNDGALPTPTAIGRFVYGNSWHYPWEARTRTTWKRWALARAMWKAPANYRLMLSDAGEAFPSQNVDEILLRIVDAAAGGRPPFLECGHRALAVAAIAESIGMTVRYVTLYSGGPVTTVWSHHVLEMKGPRGWEMHDPDYGFFLKTRAGHAASVEDVMNQPVSVAEYLWRPRIRLARHIASLIDNGFFAAVSTRHYDVEDTLFVSESGLARATFKHEGRDLPFLDYWRSVLSPSVAKSVVMTGKRVVIKGARGV